ncbi:MAG TPA: hypothetical protein VMF89_03905, partial [Polyangiales bacterium]|nr:hypothetical protein [Polyangiales bacterium]
LDFGTSTGAACGGESCTTSVNASCAEIRPQCLQSATTASLRTALPSGTACEPAKQEPSITPPRWKTRVTACEASAPQRTGCEAQALCLPTRPDNGFEAPYCIWREGQHPCAGTAFPRQRVYYRGIADTRTCSDCSCAALGCNYSWQVYNIDDLSCTMPLLQLSSAEQCAQINPDNGRLRVGATITGTGTCAATGGQSLGTVTPEDAVTMCCEN